MHFLRRAAEALVDVNFLLQQLADTPAIGRLDLRHELNRRRVDREGARKVPVQFEGDARLGDRVVLELPVPSRAPKRYLVVGEEALLTVLGLEVVSAGFPPHEFVKLGAVVSAH
ncbi:MAG: hypothetical protein CL626_03855 [Aurantimonas sp.]|nr:hypothetical protein [Aurantimonas sp.]